VKPEQLTPEDAYQFGYSGYWDGYYRTSMDAMIDLQILEHPELRMAFQRGWNAAVAEYTTLGGK